MRLLLATDSFPPVCGGSGWSTYELARGLRARGHDVIVVQPQPGTPAGRREREYDGFRVIEFGFAGAGAAVRPELLQERAAVSRAALTRCRRSSPRSASTSCTASTC